MTGPTTFHIKYGPFIDPTWDRRKQKRVFRKSLIEDTRLPREVAHINAVYYTSRAAIKRREDNLRNIED